MENFEYYGLFIDQESKQQLLNIAKNYVDKPFYKEFAHHVTLLHRSQYKPHLDFLLERFNLLKGETFPIIISEIGISDKAVAFKVEGCSEFCCNFIPHITVGTFEGGKPVDSNKIEANQWIKINPFVVHGILGVNKVVNPSLCKTKT